MKSNRSLKGNELTQLLLRLDQSATASLFDFVEDCGATAPPADDFRPFATNPCERSRRATWRIPMPPLLF